MPILARNKNQITYIYSSRSHLGVQILGYLEGTTKKVAAINIARENLADTLWAELAENLDLPFDKIFSISHPDVTDISISDDFHTHDWLKLINKNPVLLQRPILINGDTAKQLSNRSDILKFFAVDSAGLEKTMAHEPPTTSSTTEGESFV